LIKIIEDKNSIFDILINENIKIDNNISNLSLMNILEENDNLPSINDNINIEKIIEFDFKKLLNFELNTNHELIYKSFYNHNHDFLNYSNKDFILGKKRNRTENSNINDKKYEDLKIDEKENEELNNFKLEIIEKYKYFYIILRAPEKMKHLFEKYQLLKINRDSVEKYYKYKNFI